MSANIDSDGQRVKAGDSIQFSFGIPPVRVIAKVERIGSRLYAMTPDHNPKHCQLSKLREYVEHFYKV